MILGTVCVILVLLLAGAVLLLKQFAVWAKTDEDCIQTQRDYIAILEQGKKVTDVARTADKKYIGRLELLVAVQQREIATLSELDEANQKLINALQLR